MCEASMFICVYFIVTLLINKIASVYSVHILIFCNPLVMLLFIWYGKREIKWQKVFFFFKKKELEKNEDKKRKEKNRIEWGKRWRMALHHFPT